MKHASAILFPLLLATALLCTACWHEPEYPRQLVEADSAYRWGRYDVGDSLLAAYSRTMSAQEPRAVIRYQQLLTLESKFLHGKLSIDDLLLADSLREYYDSYSIHGKHAKALTVLGNIYSISNDYPTALDLLLRAEEEAAKADELWIQGIICRDEGQIYLDQRMFDDMGDYFRRSYDLACKTNDTLRMAYSAIRMGKLHTYLNNIDSIVYFYNTAIDLGKGLEQVDSIVPSARFLLADLYLQIEDFDNAKKYMTRDTLNNVNWGYWHYMQNYVDSAIYYFKKVIYCYNVYADAEYLRILGNLEREKGNHAMAAIYYEKSLLAEDSIKQTSQVEATQKMEAKHHINKIEEELEMSKKNKRLFWYTLLIILVAIIIISLILVREIRIYREKKDTQITRLQQFRQEEERKHERSLQQIEENKKVIASLEEQLEQARQQNEHIKMKQLQIDVEQLQMRNAQIMVNNQRRENLQNEFEQSNLYQRIQLNAGNPKFKLNEEEWEELAQWIDDINDNFTNRLLTMTPLNQTERSICYLTKLDVKPTNIAIMLNLTGTAVAMSRLRLYRKIFKKRGSAKDFDKFIKEF